MNRKNFTSRQRRATAVEAVIALASSSNPADITPGETCTFTDATQGLVMQVKMAGDFAAMQDMLGRLFAIHLNGIGAKG